MYMLAVIVPIFILGSFLIGTTYRLLMDYHRDLTISDNQRIRSILFEVTSRIYNISEELSTDSRLIGVLTGDFFSREDFVSLYSDYVEIQNYINNNAEIDKIFIYTDNPTISSAEHIFIETGKLMEEDWYRQALSQSNVLWTPVETEDGNGNRYWNLCLIRRIPLTASDHHAVLVIIVSDNYLRSRLDTGDYYIIASLDKEPIFYSSRHDLYGSDQVVPIDYGQAYYQYTGPYSMNFINDDPTNYLLSVSTLSIYQSSSKIYVCSLNPDAYHTIHAILLNCILIMLAAILFPGALIHFFTRYFTGRVKVLQEGLHKVSNEDYNIITSFDGEDELSEAFVDLQTMVQNNKIKDAKMYEVMINEEKFKTEQKIMEFKMLASQINPHFLYNTLETIRMKALSGGNREVANSIKLLGKSMRYVLTNTGTAATTLGKELEYVETYLTIQKLRFQDKINYSITISEGLDPAKYEVLPLVLQPVVENSILHGLEDVEADGQIHILVTALENESLEIQVRDNGRGMSLEELALFRHKIEKPNQSLSSNIGLYNINQRIRLCYGKRYGLRIESVRGEGTTVYILLPLRNEED
jgi:two-component system sensor histidine kinase YesM